MKFNKQIGIIISCIAILAVVFFGVSYFGDRDKTASNKNESNLVETGSQTNKAETAKNSSKDKTSTTNKTEDENNVTQKEEENKVSEGIKDGYYTVKESDTLFSIANTYMPNSDPAEVVEIIKQKNELTDNVISKGQKLVIPYEIALENKNNSTNENITTGDHKDHKSYVVKEGDTLFGIAKEYMSSMDIMKAIEDIKAHNNMGDSTVIKVDQTICIPASEQ